MPKDAFNIGLKFDTLNYDSKEQQTENIELPEGNYTILGEVVLQGGISWYNMKTGNETQDENYGHFLESKGCQLTETNKFIILKVN